MLCCAVLCVYQSIYIYKRLIEKGNEEVHAF